MRVQTLWKVYLGCLKILRDLLRFWREVTVNRSSATPNFVCLHVWIQLQILGRKNSRPVFVIDSLNFLWKSQAKMIWNKLFKIICVRYVWYFIKCRTILCNLEFLFLGLCEIFEAFVYLCSNYFLPCREGLFCAITRLKPYPSYTSRTLRYNFQLYSAVTRYRRGQTQLLCYHYQLALVMLNWGESKHLLELHFDLLSPFINNSCMHYSHFSCAIFLYSKYSLHYLSSQTSTSISFFVVFNLNYQSPLSISLHVTLGVSRMLRLVTSFSLIYINIYNYIYFFLFILVESISQASEWNCKVLLKS